MDKIIGLNSKTGEEREFSSIKEAQDMVGNRGTVKRCLDGKIKATKGWLFRYKDSDFSDTAKKITDKRIKVYVLTKEDEEIKLPMEMIANIYGISKSELVTVVKGERHGVARNKVKGYDVREATKEEQQEVLDSISYIEYIETIRNKKDKEYKVSVGEKIVKDILDFNNVNYQREYYLEGSQQRMDFYIENEKGKYCIEYHGQHHYRDTRTMKLEDQQELDRRKQEYCIERGITFIPFKFSKTILEIFETLKSFGIVDKRPSKFTFYRGLEINIDDFIEKYQYMDKYEICEYFDITVNDVKNIVSLTGRNLKRKFKDK